MEITEDVIRQLLAKAQGDSGAVTDRQFDKKLKSDEKRSAMAARASRSFGSGESTDFAGLAGKLAQGGEPGFLRQLLYNRFAGDGSMAGANQSERALYDAKQGPQQGLPERSVRAPVGRSSNAGLPTGNLPVRREVPNYSRMMQDNDFRRAETSKDFSQQLSQQRSSQMLKLELLKRLLGETGGGRSASTHQEIFNNAGRAQPVTLRSTQDRTMDLIRQVLGGA